MKREIDARLCRANPISRVVAEVRALEIGDDFLAAITAKPREIQAGREASPREPSPLATGRRIAGWPASRLAAAVLSCLAVGGTVMAATGVWDPGIGTRAAYSPPPTISTTPVPAAITSELGVLRREPDSLDRGPEVEATLSKLGSYFVQNVRPDSVRYLEAGEGGEATIVFSAKDSVWSMTPQAPPSDEGVNGEPICIGKPSRSEAPAICWDLNQIMSGEAFSAIQGAHISYGKETIGSGEAEGLVPDGVASITATMVSGTERHIPVHDNYFEFTWAPSEAAPSLDSMFEPQVTWHDAAGAIVAKRPASEG